MSNPTKTCFMCGQSDDHPKHVIAFGDGSEAAAHMDCHRFANPPCEVCAHQTADAAGKTGEELREHLVNLPSKDFTGSEVSE